RDRRPAKPAESRVAARARKGEDAGDAALGRLALVLLLERAEDAEVPCRRLCRRVDGKAREALLAVENHAEQAMCGDADDTAAQARHRHEAADWVALEPPLELRTRQRLVGPRLSQ